MSDEPGNCGSCGRPLRAGAFYVVRVDVFADPAMPPIDTSHGPAPGEGVDDLLAQLSTATEEELQDQVFRRFEYRVCAGCQKAILKNPLGLPRGRKLPSRN